MGRQTSVGFLGLAFYSPGCFLRDWMVGVLSHPRVGGGEDRLRRLGGNRDAGCAARRFVFLAGKQTGRTAVERWRAAVAAKTAQLKVLEAKIRAAESQWEALAKAATPPADSPGGGRGGGGGGAAEAERGAGKTKDSDAASRPAAEEAAQPAAKSCRKKNRPRRYPNRPRGPSRRRPAHRETSRMGRPQAYKEVGLCWRGYRSAADEENVLEALPRHPAAVREYVQRARPGIASAREVPSTRTRDDPLVAAISGPSRSHVVWAGVACTRW